MRRRSRASCAVEIVDRSTTDVMAHRRRRPEHAERISGGLVQDGQAMLKNDFLVDCGRSGTLLQPDGIAEAC